MVLALLGLATAQPSTRVDQRRAAAFAASKCCATPQQQRLLDSIYRHAAVQQRASVLADLDANAPSHEAGNGSPNGRHKPFYPERDDVNDRGPAVRQRMRAYDQYALPLARRAAEQALEQADIQPDRIRQLVTVTCTGFVSPGMDVQLIDALMLSPGVGRTTIGFMGCHGAINGLRVAQALAESQPGAAVLLCAVELCSLHFQYGWDAQRTVANALFADGAAAVVGIAQDNRRADAPRPWRVAATGSCLLPNSRDAMTWTIGDHGFEMTLSPDVPRLIQSHLKTWLTGWLAERALTIGDIGSWAVHPGGPRVLDAVEDALGLDDQALAESRNVLGQCGNMSSPTVLFIADRLQRHNAPRPCVMLAFGPGLVAEAALLI